MNCNNLDVLLHITASSSDKQHFKLGTRQTYHSFIWSVSRLVGLSDRQTDSQSVSQPASQSVSRQTASQPVSQSVSQLVSQTASHSVSRHTDSQSVSRDESVK